MTVPENPLDQVKVDVPEPVYTSAKALAATFTLTSGLVLLFVKQVADGSISGAEAWELFGGLATAAAAVAGVWKTKNKRVS